MFGPSQDAQAGDRAPRAKFGGLMRMLPAYTAGDTPDRRLRDSEPFTDLALAEMRNQGAYFSDLFGLQLAHTARRSTFEGHINQIVLARAKEEMIGPTATGIVAAMAYEHSFWDWAIGEFPCNP